MNKAGENLVKDRERRKNAGSKMAQLIGDEEQTDEFYKDVYGGFMETQDDTMYDSGEEASSSDTTDSDIDDEEEDEEEEDDDDHEETEKDIGRKTRHSPPNAERVKLPKTQKKSSDNRGKSRTKLPFYVKKGLKKPKKLKNRHRHCLSQAQRLQEAQKTEELNSKSLAIHQNYEKTEKEKRLKQARRKKRQTLLGPRIKYTSLKSGEFGNVRGYLDFESTDHFRLLFPDTTRKAGSLLRRLCSVTSRPAKYRDPLTGLYYSSPLAFKHIRDEYELFIKNNES